MQWNLVGDIGGTNARLALVEEGSTEIQAIRNFSSSEFESFADVIETYLAAIDTSQRPHSACLAVASPVTSDRIQFTNNPWTFSICAFQEQFNWKQLKVINDFEAIARCLPWIGASELLHLGGPKLEGRTGTKAVLGPGTGLGMAALLQAADGAWIPLATEGGHAGFSPTTKDERQLHDWLLTKRPFVCWEDFLSGQGLVTIWQALAEQEAGDMSNGTPSPSDITTLGLADASSLARKVLNLFCLILGNAAGNYALQTGAVGGVYIAGGIIPRFPEFFAASGFRAAFEAKGSYTEYVQGIPTYLIQAKQPGLVGAAAALLAISPGGTTHA